MTLVHTSADFATTQWTLVARLQSEHAERRAVAAGELAERYWPAIYAYLRRRGTPPERAAELTQAFFSEVVLSRHLFERATEERGRLRSLLLKALHRFMIDDYRHELARGSKLKISLDEMEREERFVTGEGAVAGAEAFERRWALSVVDEALQRTERHFVDSGRGGHWRAFEKRVKRPAWHGIEPMRLAQIAAEEGFSSSASAGAAVRTVKKRLLVVLREVIAETVEPEELDDEYERFVTMLEGR